MGIFIESAIFLVSHKLYRVRSFRFIIDRCKKKSIFVVSHTHTDTADKLINKVHGSTFP